MLLATALRAQSPQIESAFREAQELETRGRLEQAEEKYRALLRQSPADVRALSSLGVVLAREGRYEEAIANYKRALALNPRLPARVSPGSPVPGLPERRIQSAATAPAGRSRAASRGRRSTSNIPSAARRHLRVHLRPSNTAFQFAEMDFSSLKNRAGADLRRREISLHEREGRIAGRRKKRLTRPSRWTDYKRYPSVGQ